MITNGKWQKSKGIIANCPLGCGWIISLTLAKILLNLKVSLPSLDNNQSGHILKKEIMTNREWNDTAKLVE